MPDELENQQDDSQDTPRKEEPKAKPPANTTDWEASYKGLQRVNDRLQKKLDDLQAKYDVAVEELEGLKTSNKNDATMAEGLKKSITDKDAEILRLKGELDKATAKQTRTRVILTEFPELAAFEGSELLPEGGTEEEIKEKLTRFKEALGKMVGEEILAKVKGAGPSSGPKKDAAELNEDQVYDRMVSLAGTQDPVLQQEYNQLLEKWHAIQEQA